MADDKLKDGPYAYYPTKDSALPPIICEIVAGYVCEVLDDHMRPLSDYGGKFVRLVEQDEDEAKADGTEGNAPIAT